MAKFTTAFSLTHEVLNEIEARRGTDNRSAFVDRKLRESLGLDELEKKEHRSPSPQTNETGMIPHCDNEVIQ